MLFFLYLQMFYFSVGNENKVHFSLHTNKKSQLKTANQQLFNIGHVSCISMHLLFQQFLYLNKTFDTVNIISIIKCWL